MKQMFGLMLAAVILLGSTAAFAAGGCCAAGGAKGEAKCAAGGVLDKMTLTDDQKAKIAALREECGKAGCPVEGRQKMMSGMKEILTAEQFSQFKAECDKAGKGGGCPVSKDDAKSKS